MGLASQRRNWLWRRVSGPLRGIFVPQRSVDRSVGLLLIFKRPAARESPKAMEPPAVSRFLYQANHRRRKSKYQGEFLQPKSVLSQRMAKSNNFISLQPLGALFSSPSLCFQSVAASFREKRGGVSCCEIPTDKLVEITTRFACSRFR